jgi:NAD(P)-dependent dehydrogenase (short-subunit alcohol dehydrogenase family)
MRALVTGGNRGIGLELCKQLAARGSEVIAAVRAPSRELSALGVEVALGIDLTETGWPERLRAAVGSRNIDLLINNAGILQGVSLETLDVEAIRHQLEVNAIAPLRVTHALLERLGHGAKVALVTSRMGSIADNGSGGSYGYRMSKAALNAAGKSLAIDLAARGVAVAILHPGWVQTDMTGGSGQLSAAQSARMLLTRIDELTPETSGTFWHADGSVLPW